MIELLSNVELPGGAPAGWVGASMLGGVLGWLLFVYLPSKDKQLKEILEMQDKHVEALTVQFRDSLDKVIEHCKQEIAAIREWDQRMGPSKPNPLG